MGQWGPASPLPEIWKTPPGSPMARAAEQDHAAGGRSNRLVELTNGQTATASISLQHFKRSRRVYAYLRYKSGGHTTQRYVGDATASNREEALAIAWKQARAKKLLTESPHTS
jgi:DNA mismatch endonuclease (patch repair protein)